MQLLQNSLNIFYRPGNPLLNTSSSIYDHAGATGNSGGISYAMYNEIKEDVPFHPYGPPDYGMITFF